MGNYTITTCDIDGLLILEPAIHRDERGYFFEAYNEADFHRLGITNHFVQDNQSMSTKGIFRGLHYQHKHSQAKLVRALFGEIYDVVVDLRKSSRTYGASFGILLSAENQKQLFVPKGFAHGYFVLSEQAVFSYKCDDYYTPGDEYGILWSDPAIRLSLPCVPGLSPIPNERDAHWNTLSEAKRLGLVFP